MMLRYVDHTYRDYSRYIDDGGRIPKHKKSDHNFPAKVHEMLSDPRHSEVVAWMPHGRAWKVLDKEKLMSTVLPEYLTCKKYESFSRQLNGWGFKRLYQSGPDLGCYYHECFLRDLPKLTALIRRLPANLGKATPYPAGEPNFYRISERFPVPPAAASTNAEEEEGATSYTPPTIHHQQGAPSAHPQEPLAGQPNDPRLAASATGSAAPDSSRQPPPPHDHSQRETQHPSTLPQTSDSLQSTAGFSSSAAPAGSYTHPGHYYSQDAYYQHQQHPHSSEYSQYHQPSYNYSGQQQLSYGYDPTHGYPPQHLYQSFQPPAQYYDVPPNLPARDAASDSHSVWHQSAEQLAAPPLDSLDENRMNSHSVQKEEGDPDMEPIPISNSRHIKEDKVGGDDSVPKHGTD